MATQLNVRSYYSLLDGVMSPENILKTAKELGYTSVALTDVDALYGALEFAHLAKKYQIKPIYGLEVNIQEEDFIYQSLVIAKNNEGYLNLIKISNLLQSQQYITLHVLKSYLKDLWLILYVEKGPFEKELLEDDWAGVEEKIRYWKNEVPSLFIGISHQESEFFRPYNDKILQFIQEVKIPAVALPKVYYRHKEDFQTLKLLNAIKDQVSIHDSGLISKPNRYFLGPKEMQSLYSEELIENSDFIAKESNVDLLKISTSLPQYVTGSVGSNDAYLKQLTTIGLNKRLNHQVSEVYKKRLDYELDIIIKMNFVDYFLIVFDLIRFAKTSNIYVGPGRGSSAGSLIAYCLGITDVDPIKYDLLFERFLNPMRISMPDIDIDFPDNKRQHVIDYVKNKYGNSHVAHIPTFGTLKARQAFRDTARTYQISLSSVDKITKLIGNSSLQSALNSQKLKNILESQPALLEVYQQAMSIEGIPRHTSIHAAGVVLSHKVLEDVAPTFEIDEDMRVLQYSMDYLESIGLIKIDFLGLRNLTLIDRISNNIREEQPSFRITDIPLNDPETFKLLRMGQTSGIFQLESKGMTNLLVDAKVDRFMDIVDVIALYRPGPMENIPTYLSARRNPKQIDYFHPDLKPITLSTYGILIYQEQIMQVAQKFAGFTLAKADILRKAMSKKDAKVLEGLRAEFILGAINNGYESKFSHQLFELIYKFANYGFNKSHSVVYGVVAYQLAYLKANYSLYFYNHLLNSVIGSETKTQEYMQEAKRVGVKILGIKLDQSSYEYTLEDGKVRLPLTLIKGISHRTAKLIRDDVLVHGRYTSFYNAIARLYVLKINQKQIESIIKAGGLDYFSEHRLDMLSSLEGAIGYARLITVESDGQISLNPHLISEPVMIKGEENHRLILDYELEVLGFYTSTHPLTLYKQQNKGSNIKDIKEGMRATIYGSVVRIKTHYTKKGDLMAFVSFKDEYDTIDLVIFPKVYQKVHITLEKGVYYKCMGTMKEMGSLIVDDIIPIEINRRGDING